MYDAVVVVVVGGGSGGFVGLVAAKSNVNVYHFSVKVLGQMLQFPDGALNQWARSRSGNLTVLIY